MKYFSTIDGIRAERQKLGLVGFVPTMGALHEGHLSLVQISVEQNEHTVVSIFVNPTQFGPNEDFDRYPRTLAQDLSLLEIFGDQVSIFHPQPTEIYRQERFIRFDVQELGNVLCGKSRPGHFNGVVEVVAKLFNIVQPNRAYFGAKDFQQTVILRRMVQELFMPIEMIIVPTIREADGLAMSSRNRYLSPDERNKSTLLYHTLVSVKEQAELGQPTEPIIQSVYQRFNTQSDIRLDYFDIVSDQNLAQMSEINDHSFAVIAAYIGKTRLIDNLKILE
jgi:pantoate--beta-alanine ligase